MATITRPQLVLKSLQSDGQYMTHDTIQVTKTATMTYGTLLEADATESVTADITAGTVAYVIDDLAILSSEVATGDVLTVSAVHAKGMDWVIFKADELKLGSTALSGAELTTFAKSTQ